MATQSASAMMKRHRKGVEAGIESRKQLEQLDSEVADASTEIVDSLAQGDTTGSPLADFAIKRAGAYTADLFDLYKEMDEKISASAGEPVLIYSERYSKVRVVKMQPGYSRDSDYHVYHDTEQAAKHQRAIRPHTVSYLGKISKRGVVIGDNEWQISTTRGSNFMSWPFYGPAHKRQGPIPVDDFFEGFDKVKNTVPSALNRELVTPSEPFHGKSATFSVRGALETQVLIGDEEIAEAGHQDLAERMLRQPRPPGHHGYGT